jgi:DNA-binding response OmpR family regulator
MSRRIVIIDDDRDILHILAELFASEGYQPQTFATGERALAYMVAERPTALLTDLLMPGMDGYAVIKHTRQLWGATLPIIVMSASVDMSMLQLLPIQAFLAKPFDLDEIVEVVGRWVVAPAFANHPTTARRAELPILRLRLDGDGPR